MKSVFALTMFFSSSLHACPFCDFGANETARFILIFFGLMALGGAFIFAAYLRSGGFKASDGVQASVLKAEGVTEEEEK